MLISKNEKSWEEDSSWLWHQDGYLPGSHLKMFCYLNDVTNDNGAFQFHNSINSKRYIRQGFLKVLIKKRKFNNKFILEKLNKSFNSVER